MQQMQQRRQQSRQRRQHQQPGLPWGRRGPEEAIGEAGVALFVFGVGVWGGLLLSGMHHHLRCSCVQASPSS
eukprot:1097396-Alexandrium_andersonii.AAC.1